MIKITAKKRVEEYLKNNNIKTNRFYGKCLLTDRGFLVIGDILSKEEGNLLLREDGDRLQIFTGKDNSYFETEKFYEFSIYIPAEQSKKDLVVVLDLKNLPPIEININPYQEIVRLRYERLDNPEANKMIANLMREIGKGLYSSKQRMIFELLQNADDTPAGNEVSFHIDAYYDYLLIMHNGLPFNQDDVEAITSAAESTKRNDRKKTGYKGIGFKSVFTDSEEVLIKSGGFQFVFKRNHTAYTNFDSFYLGKKRYTDYPTLLVEDKLKYAKQRKTFNGNTDIPWQLIPVWSHNLPKSLENSKLATYNNNVGFAIKFGKDKVDEYLEAVASFSDSPQFMLFLRHVNNFKAFKSYINIITIKKIGQNPVLIERINQDGNTLKLTYFKKEIDDIKVNDEALAEEGIIIYKRQRENEYGEVSHYFSSDIKGEKPIESIPPKLASFDETAITFAVPIIDKIIRAEPNYLLGRSFSSFFTFLPMKETRISLPFLINADFVPSADRESLQGDNEWNEYIISKIAYNHVKWIKEIAENSINNKEKQPEYLSLLLKELLPDDFSIRMIIKKYNYTYLKSINEVGFIISDKNSICKTSEILIDSTGISTQLGTEFFYSITVTEKHLPNININATYLLYEYLEIQKFKSKNLVDLLTQTENKLILKAAIKLLKIDEYLQFLNWFNEFIYLNTVSSDWLLSMPIIRIKDEVVSFIDALSNGQYHFKTQRTKNIELILPKIGFDLSDIYIDDQKYQHLNGILLQQDTYLKTDLKLYEHIAAANNLSNLTATEKNTLITFFESLDEVGKARYAKSLSLFKSKQKDGLLKPLNRLISNSCIGLPDWLSDFAIDSEEEKALSITFQTHLLKEKDLFEKLFCNSDSFTEIIANINAENIAEFYSYLLKLHEAKPKDANIDYSKIPWVFLESNSTFAPASAVYWPESITKLSAPKYASIKLIFETNTDEKLPHQAALQIKAPFALGGKHLKLTEITPKPNSFDVIAVNDFLDWAEANGEKDLLNHLSFSKIDVKFSMGKVSRTLCYYTADESLITFIQVSAINTKLSLFPKELYTNERHKIGLLEGISLLKHLIENGLSTPALAKYIQGANDTQLSIQYLEMLAELNINSSKSYTIEDAEFKILKLVVQHLIDDDAKLASFKKKILLDSHSFVEKAFSDDIRFYKEGVAPIEIKTKLKEILPAYQNQTYSISNVILKFIDFRDDSKLIKIFKSESRTPSRIYKELNELKPTYFSPAQTFFLSYYKTLNPNEDVFKDKVLFANANSDNPIQYKSDVHEFLEICLKENSYIGFLAQGILQTFNPINLVSSEEYAIDVEKLPIWLSEWVNKSDTDTKNSYLKLIGINDESSPVVLYRKAIKETQLEPMAVNCALINNDTLLINSLTWLSLQNINSNFILKKEVLQPLYQKLLNRKVTIDKLMFPYLLKYEVDSYSLYNVNEGDELHFIHLGWGEFKQLIFSNVESTNKITDEVLPKVYRDAWKVIEKPFEKMADSDNIVSKSFPFDEEYYQEWALKSQFNIQIYNGTQLPYLIKYNGILINSIKDKYADYIGNIYYVVESKKESILFYLEGVLPESALNALKLQKQNLIEKEKEAEKKIQFTEEESEVWRKLFGNEIPQEFYLDINLAACVTALVVLSKNGYNVSKADSNLFSSHGFAQVEPVFKQESDVPLTIMCRSAIGGILYLTAQAWDRLDNKDIHLFVKTGRKENNSHLFLDKNDVLKISDTKYQVFRVEADSESSTTDQILRGEFAKDKIWLILKMKDTDTYKSIFEGGIKRNEENPDYDNLNTSENSPY